MGLLNWLPRISRTTRETAGLDSCGRRGARARSCGWWFLIFQLGGSWRGLESVRGRSGGFRVFPSDPRQGRFFGSRRMGRSRCFTWNGFPHASHELSFKAGIKKLPCRG